MQPVQPETKKSRVDSSSSSSHWPRAGSAPLARTSSSPSGVERFGLFVGGFGRPLADHLRKAHWEAEVAPLLSSRLQGVASLYAPHMEKHYIINFDHNVDRDSALDALKGRPMKYHDNTYNSDHELYFKMARDLESLAVALSQPLVQGLRGALWCPWPL